MIDLWCAWLYVSGIQVHRWSRQPYVRGGYSGPCIGSSQWARRSAQLPLSVQALLSDEYTKHADADPTTPEGHSYVEVLSKLREELLQGSSDQKERKEIDDDGDEDDAAAEEEHKALPRERKSSVLSNGIHVDEDELYIGAGKDCVLFFSGEALSETGFGSVHAALESGELAAQQILVSF